MRYRYDSSHTPACGTTAERGQLTTAVTHLLTQMRIARLVVPTVTRAVVAAVQLEVWLERAAWSSDGATRRRVVGCARDVGYWLTVVRNTDLVQRCLVEPVLLVSEQIIDGWGAHTPRMLKEDAMPRDNALQIQSFGLAVQVVTIAQHLTPSPQNVAIVEGFVRSGTRIGAHIERALVEGGVLAHSADIIAAVDCIHETLYWLRVLEVSQLVAVQVTEPLYVDCEALLGVIEQMCAHPVGMVYRPDYDMVAR